MTVVQDQVGRLLCTYTSSHLTASFFTISSSTSSHLDILDSRKKRKKKESSLHEISNMRGDTRRKCGFHKTTAARFVRIGSRFVRIEEDEERQ